MSALDTKKNQISHCYYTRFFLFAFNMLKKIKTCAWDNLTLR